MHTIGCYAIFCLFIKYTKGSDESHPEKFNYINNCTIFIELAARRLNFFSCRSIQMGQLGVPVCGIFTCVTL